MVQNNKGKYFDVGLTVFFAAIIAVRFHPVLKSFWLYDDPYILRHAIDYRPWEYFLVPDVWREMSIRYLTPWVTFSFDLDLWLFGLNRFS